MKKVVSCAVKVLVLSLAGALLFSSCQKEQITYPEQILMVPQNAGLVFVADLESLDAKLPEENAAKSSLSQIVKEQVDDEFLDILCNDSTETGIEHSEIVAFMISEKQFGLAVQLNDAAAFESKIKSLTEESDSIIIEEKDGVKYCSSKDSEMTLVWNDNKALFVVETGLSEALVMFNQEEGHSIACNKVFGDFYINKKEIAVWMDMETYLSIYENISKFKFQTAFPLMPEFMEMYEGVYASCNIEFLDGEVVVEQKMMPLQKAEKISQLFYKEKVSEKLLSAIPSNSYMLLSFAVNVSEYMDVLASVPEFKDLREDPEAEEIVNSLDGDIVLSISDFAPGPMPIPNAVIGMSVKDETILNSIKDIDGIQKIDKEGYTALLIQMFQVYVAQKDDLLLLSTDENVIKSFAEGKKLEDNLSSSKHKKAFESAAYFYLELDLDKYPDAIKGLLQSRIGEDYTAISDVTCFDNLSGMYDSNTCESKTVIKLKDKDVNSLTALSEMSYAIFSLYLGDR